MRASRLGSTSKPLSMLSHKNAMVVLYILFALLYAISGVKRKDSGWKQLKATLNAKHAGPSDGAAKTFLTKLYINYFNQDGQMKSTNTAIPEIIHSVQGTGMILFTIFIFGSTTQHITCTLFTHIIIKKGSRVFTHQNSSFFCCFACTLSLFQS